MSFRSHPRLREVGADCRGTSVMELALVAPVLCLMLAGIVDLAMGFSSRLTLEQAAYRALERVMVGGVQDDYSFLRAEAASAAGVTEDKVTVDQWLECNQVRQPSFSGSCPSGQQTGRYVQITVNSTYRPSFSWGPLGTRFGQSADGTIPIQAIAAVRVR